MFQQGRKRAAGVKGSAAFTAKGSIILKRINLKFAFENIIAISLETANYRNLWKTNLNCCELLFRSWCRYNQQLRLDSGRIYKFGGRLFPAEPCFLTSIKERQFLFLFAPVWSNTLDQYNSREINLLATASGGNATSWEAAIIQPQTFAQVLTTGNVKQFNRHDWSFSSFQIGDIGDIARSKKRRSSRCLKMKPGKAMAFWASKGWLLR